MGVCTSAKSNAPRTGGTKNNISTKNSNNTKSEGNKQCIVSSNTITSNGDIIHNRKCIRQKNHHYTVRAPNIKLKDLVSTSKVIKQLSISCCSTIKFCIEFILSSCNRQSSMYDWILVCM